jgi:hypothetical protein
LTYGFFGTSLMVPATFQAEGEYRIRFVYSTDNADPKSWLGDVGGNVTEIQVVKMLANVPKTTASSNEITVKVVRPKK